MMTKTQIKEEMVSKKEKVFKEEILKLGELLKKVLKEVLKEEEEFQVEEILKDEEVLEKEKFLKEQDTQGGQTTQGERWERISWKKFLEK